MANDTGAAPLNWQLLLFRGGLSIAIGVGALLFPRTPLNTFTFILAAYMAVDGIVALMSSVRGSGTARDWSGGYALRAGIGVLAAFAFTIAPSIPAISYPFATLAITCTWAVASGLAEIVAVLKWSGEGQRGWVLVAAGLLSLVLAMTLPVILFFNPDGTVVATAWVVGLFLCAIGALLALQALLFRRKFS